MMINGHNTARVLAILASVAAVSSGWANGFRLADQDAFATARGEAFVATADNASAVYYNPAGLTQLEGQNVRGGLYYLYMDPTFRPPDNAANAGTTYHIKDKLNAVPQFFYAYTPEAWPVSFGFGTYAPYGGNMSWPQDTGFRTVATEGKLEYLRMNPAVAVKLGPELSIGAGLEVDYSRIKLEGGLARNINLRFPADYFRFKGDGWSAGCNVGVLWQPLEQLSFGATFRSPTPIDYDGSTDFYRPTSTPQTHRSADMRLDFPLGAVVGVSYRPTPKWNLEFNADYTDWGSFDNTTIHQSGPPDGQESVVPMDIDQTLDWRGSWMYELGVTRYFPKGWHASAGFVFNESSVPDAHYSPLAADLDRYFFSLGGGFTGQRYSLDVAYQFGYGPSHTVSGSSPSSLAGVINNQNADGKYDFISHAVIVTFGLHF